MELLGGSRPRDLTGTVKQLEVAPAPARLGDEAGEVKLSVGRQLHAQRVYERGPVLEQVGEPEPEDGAEPVRGERQGEQVSLRQADGRRELRGIVIAGGRDGCPARSSIARDRSTSTVARDKWACSSADGTLTTAW